MIVVLGRPRLDERGALAGRAGRICAAAAGTGAGVELVGSVTDDANGDATITRLGRDGIGHAAVLRMPTSGQPRLDAADIDLGLRYVSECRVLVVADALDEHALAAALDGARYHGAALVVAATQPAMPAENDLPEQTTLLEAEEEDDGAFAGLVGRYAALLDSGTDPSDAWRDAVSATGWEATEEESTVGTQA